MSAAETAERLANRMGATFSAARAGETADRARSNAAASQAVGAAVELLRFAREGAFSRDFAFEADPIAELAKALSATIAIEAPRLADEHRYFGVDAEGGRALAGLQTALAAFLAAWA